MPYKVEYPYNDFVMIKSNFDMFYSPGIRPTVHGLFELKIITKIDGSNDEEPSLFKAWANKESPRFRDRGLVKAPTLSRENLIWREHMSFEGEYEI